MTCLCTGRTGIRCGEVHCDLAGPGTPGNPNECRVCWLRLKQASPASQPATQASRPPCDYLGEPTGETVICPTCKGGVKLKTFACAIHGVCTPGNQAPGVACCESCPDHKSDGGRAMRWAYGVTTVPERRNDLLPRTLTSLAAGGFATPRLFVDGDADAVQWQTKFGLPVTPRFPRIRTAANWHLAALELYLRDPFADRYAVFQDDFVTCRNLRVYLERVPYPRDGYLNLYTFPSNQKLAPGTKGFYPSNQLGRGAVALVFDRGALMALLGDSHLIAKAQDVHRGHKAIDGGVVESMKRVGKREYVHDPSLVQHVGEVSVMGNSPHPKAASFPGEDFDAASLPS